MRAAKTGVVGSGGEAMPTTPSRRGICTFDGCTRTTRSSGLCRSHFEQRRRGMALQPLMVMNSTIPQPLSVPGGVLGAWRTDAACATSGIHPESWFSEEVAEIERAASICQGCPVRTQCLTEARQLHVNDGIWGGVVFGRKPPAPNAKRTTAA